MFIGVGRPSTAAILARMVHNPDLVLVYESGTIGAKPHKIPLSIGDGELAETADVVVSVPEMFNYWIGTGRVEVAFLGAAQVDRFGNLNSTVIGDYAHPKTRLPGAGGAPGDRRLLPRGGGHRAPLAPGRSCPTWTSAPPWVSATVRRTANGWACAEGADRGHHRPGGARARCGQPRADPDPDPSRRDRRTRARADGLGAAGGRPVAETPPPTDAELDALRELLSR